jgi:hypothetical protein
MSQPPSFMPPGPPSQPAQFIIKPSAGFAVGALVCGLIALIPPLGIVMGLVAISLGIVSLAQRRRGKGMAAAGIVLGLIGLIVTPTVLVYAVRCLVSSVQQTVGRIPAQMAQSMSAAQLNSIAMAIQMYMDDNDGTAPPDLQTLVDAGMIAPEMLKSPMGGTGRERDYFYFPPAEDAEDRALVACGLTGGPAGGRNVLRHGGTVELLTETDFQAELAEPQNAAFAAALKKAETASQPRAVD